LCHCHFAFLFCFVLFFCSVTWKQIPRRGKAGSKGKCRCVFLDLANFPSKGVVRFSFPQPCVKVPVSTQSCKQCRLSIFRALDNLLDEKDYQMRVSFFISFVMSYFESLFTCVRAICISPWIKLVSLKGQLGAFMLETQRRVRCTA
jgi:hypothetical protein